MKLYHRGGVIISSIDPTKIVVVGERARKQIASVPETGMMKSPEREETAARIAACWNACEGIEDPSVVPELLAYITESASNGREWAKELVKKAKGQLS